MTLLLALDFLKSLEFINSSRDFIKSDFIKSDSLSGYTVLCSALSTRRT